ncbi:MAG: UDP-4-amino-4,6-dideoxy-N-acetyl-beta-L-altrosamine transaminase [Flavobacteriales bacterium]|nr:UDP-4-amino-4,6-dideoxy-N-acetyl-beta-L-altrosamine transaminase [Bacteroidota bacterium]MCB9239853.1 UDP-4-amino-4,6-dideoxy-N-acetyl-beta-L-altrosamine transaminase [Flavobacteriales bacterium]
MNIPYGKQSIDRTDLEAVERVLTSDFMTQGPEIARFEEAFNQRMGAPYSIAVSNGTAALHLAVLALGLKPNQRVITSPITFAASANCVAYAGGVAEFCDIDPATYLIDLQKLEEMLKVKPHGYYAGIIPVDFGGLSVNLERVRALADQYGCWVLEDACHAPGATFTDSKGNQITAGDCTYSDAAIFSFHPVKHIACGEGGMITTSSKEVNQSLQVLRTHGITKDSNLMTENHGGWYYEMIELGYNYRLTDMQAALGLTQLAKLDWSLEQRNRIARKYDELFKKLGWPHQLTPGGCFHAYHLYVIQHPKRKELYDYLREHGVFAQVHYIPVHLLPYYQDLGWKKGDCPNAERYYDQCLSLPMYPTLTDEEFNYVSNLLISFDKQ